MSPLPDVPLPDVLSADQVARFGADGFLICESFFAEGSLRQIRRWVEEVAGWENGQNGCVQYRERTTRGPVPARTERFLSGHVGLRETLTAGSLITAIGQLFGEPAILFKEKINYKYPGGGAFAAHQDAVAYEPFGSHHITALVAIDPNTMENGCLWFAAGEHHRGMLPTNDRGCLPERVEREMEWQAGPIEPGGVVFFSSLAPHRSPSNRSSASRRSLYVTYCKASEGELRDAYYEDRAAAIEAAGGDAASLISRIGHFQGETIKEKSHETQR